MILKFGLTDDFQTKLVKALRHDLADEFNNGKTELLDQLTKKISEEKDQAKANKSREMFHALQMQASESAVGYGQLAIRTCFLLNGGALITLPTLANAFHPNVFNSGFFHFGIIFLILGVVSAGIGTICAYCAMSSRHNDYAEKTNIKLFDEKPDGKYNQHRIGALSAGILSIVLFIAGAASSGYAVYDRNDEAHKACVYITPDFEICWLANKNG